MTRTGALLVLLGICACTSSTAPTVATVTVAPPAALPSAQPESPPEPALVDPPSDTTPAPEVFAQGKVTLVHFFASWCDPCKKSMPMLDDFYKSHAGRVAVVAIGEDDDEADMRAFVSQKAIVFPVLWDHAKSRAMRWHPTTMPTTFVVDKHGALRYTHAGYRDEDGDTLQSEIKGLLAER